MSRQTHTRTARHTDREEAACDYILGGFIVAARRELHSGATPQQALGAVAERWRPEFVTIGRRFGCEAQIQNFAGLLASTAAAFVGIADLERVDPAEQESAFEAALRSCDERSRPLQQRLGLAPLVRRA